MTALDHSHYMDIAMRLAARGVGLTWPNPSVGCVIVTSQGEVVGRGATAPMGRPHAETQALARAGVKAKGATAYVSLEPCTHHGKTPPCAEALLKAGVACVVIAAKDPDARVSGRSIEYLRQNHIDVMDGIGTQAGEQLNEGFFKRVLHQRPHVTLKLATSRDGKIGATNGQSRWITNEESRMLSQYMRAQADAIMVGSATALVDDPELTCRLEGMEEQSPVRIVADGRLRLELTSKLVRTLDKAPLWILTRADADQTRARALRELGVRLFEIEPDANGNLDMRDGLAALADAGLTRLLVEGGARLAAALMGAELVDRLVWFTAPFVIGGDGFDAIGALGLEKIGQAAPFKLVEQRRLKNDMLAIYDAMR